MNSRPDLCHLKQELFRQCSLQKTSQQTLEFQDLIEKCSELEKYFEIKSKYKSKIQQAEQLAKVLKQTKQLMTTVNNFYQQIIISRTQEIQKKQIYKNKVENMLTILMKVKYKKYLHKALINEKHENIFYQKMRKKQTILKNANIRINEKKKIKEKQLMKNSISFNALETQFKRLNQKKNKLSKQLLQLKSQAKYENLSVRTNSIASKFETSQINQNHSYNQSQQLLVIEQNQIKTDKHVDKKKLVVLIILLIITIAIYCIP